MAEEPQPSDFQEGAEPPQSLPASKEDRKAAQALSSLDVKGDEDAAAKPKKEVDLKALGEAMKNLELTQGAKKPTEAINKREEAPKKLVKVDAADVSLLMDQLDVSKNKATELLRAHDADAIRAMTAWVSASDTYFAEMRISSINESDCVLVPSQVRPSYDSDLGQPQLHRTKVQSRKTRTAIDKLYEFIYEERLARQCCPPK